jgi:hypothetical protein
MTCPNAVSSRVIHLVFHRYQYNCFSSLDSINLVYQHPLERRSAATDTMTSNRSSDDDDKIHEIEALLLESKTTANDCLISQLLRSYIGILWGVRSRVFTCPTFLVEPQVTTYLPTYLPPAPCDLYIYLQLVSMPFRRSSVTSGHLVRALAGNDY